MLAPQSSEAERAAARAVAGIMIRNVQAVLEALGRSDVAGVNSLREVPGVNEALKAFGPITGLPQLGDNGMMSIKHLSLEGRQLPGVDLSGLCFVGTDFRNANLDQAHCLGTRFIQCDLSGGSMNGVRGAGSLFRETSMPGSAIRGDFRDATFERLSIAGMSTAQAKFGGATFSGVHGTENLPWKTTRNMNLAGAPEEAQAWF